MVNFAPLRKHGRALAAICVLLGFFIILFRRVIFAREVMLGGDAFYYSLPLRSIAFNMLGHGELPLWLPSLMGGYPMLSMSQLALAYPLTWGYLFLPGHWAEQIYVASPFLLASIFTFIFVRALGRSHAASLLAALSFAYGGLFLPTVTGFLTNSMMWLPLMLLAVEWSRSKNLVQCTALSTFAYSLSVLNGVGQGFLYVGLLTIAYALFIALFVQTSQRYRPLVVALLGIAFATGLTAFQTFETWVAVRHSIRQGLDYQTFIEGSYNTASALRSFVSPRFNMVDVSPYVTPIAAALALVALVYFRADKRILFWFVVVIVAFLLMLGGNTPLYSVIYRLPLVSLFRVPARHAFEWTFGLSVLAAFGWDSLATRVVRSEGRRKFVITSILTLAVIAVVVVWLRNFDGTEANYLTHKIVVTLLALVTLWLLFKQRSTSLTFALSLALIGVICYAEASILFQHLWYPNRRPTNTAFVVPAPATTFLKQFSPNESRVYTDGPHVDGAFDSFNLAPYFGLNSVAGYEPAMLTRFSNALGNVGPDTSQTRNGFSPQASLFEPGSHVLDLLNTRYVTTFWDLGNARDIALTKGGIEFGESAAPLKLKPGETSTFSVNAGGDTLAIVSSLGYAGGAVDGQPVASIEVTDENNSSSSYTLKAGTDTAEWAHERPDIRTSANHKLAPVFDSHPGDEQNSFTAHRYLAKIALNTTSTIARIKFQNVSGFQFILWKLTVHSSQTNSSTVVPLVGPTRWETVWLDKRVAVVENKRALPRVWLASATQSVTKEEALKIIREREDFDPRQLALVESPAGVTFNPATSAGATVKLLSFSANQLELETQSTSPAFVVISEVYYPGWEAEVDGVSVPIYPTDYLLRGVYVNSGGRHQIRLRYRAPAARYGLFVGVATMLIMVAGMVHGLRRRHREN